MTDQEKIIKGLEYCAGNHLCSGCRYYDPDNARCQKDLMRDALELLEAQEPVKPELRMSKWGFKQWLICGACGGTITFKVTYCPYCGRKVKWNENCKSE